MTEQFRGAVDACAEWVSWTTLTTTYVPPKEYVWEAWGEADDDVPVSPKSQSYWAIESPESGSVATAVKFTVNPLTVYVGHETCGGVFALADEVATGIAPLLYRAEAFTWTTAWVASDVYVATTVTRLAFCVPETPDTSTQVT
jgi:hypothetical protein